MVQHILDRFYYWLFVAFSATVLGLVFLFLFEICFGDWFPERATRKSIDAARKAGEDEQRAVGRQEEP